MFHLWINAVFEMAAWRSSHSDPHTAAIHSGSVFRAEPHALATQERFLSSSHSAPVSYKWLRALSDACSPRAGRTCAGSKLKSALTQRPDHNLLLPSLGVFHCESFHGSSIQRLEQRQERFLHHQTLLLEICTLTAQPPPVCLMKC